jgi:hypothetical protein
VDEVVPPIVDQLPPIVDQLPPIVDEVVPPIVDQLPPIVDELPPIIDEVVPPIVDQLPPIVDELPPVIGPPPEYTFSESPSFYLLLEGETGPGTVDPFGNLWSGSEPALSGLSAYLPLDLRLLYLALAGIDEPAIAWARLFEQWRAEFNTLEHSALDGEAGEEGGSDSLEGDSAAGEDEVAAPDEADAAAPGEEAATTEKVGPVEEMPPLSPSPGGLLADFLPFDPYQVDRIMQEFVARVDQGGEELGEALQDRSLYPWLVVAGLAATAYEIARRRMQAADLSAVAVEGPPDPAGA